MFEKYSGSGVHFLYNKRIKRITVKLSYLLRWMPDEVYLFLLYFVRTGKWLHLNNPRRFNEKIQWLKVYDHNPVYTEMADKFAVKKYCSNIIGEEYIIPTLGKWNNFEEIDFSKLPEQFVLKCNHDSGGLYICRDRTGFNKIEAKKRIEYCLKRNYYFQNREWAYKNIKPCVFAEQYMEDNDSEDIQDYKFMCFNGRVKCLFVCSERYSENGLKVTFFDREWNEMPFERHYCKSKKQLVKPQNFEKMIQLSEKLAKGLRFVRVDLYEINGRVYFGEMTFYPGSGMEVFRPDKWDHILGSWLEL